MPRKLAEHADTDGDEVAGDDDGLVDDLVTLPRLDGEDAGLDGGGGGLGDANAALAVESDGLIRRDVGGRGAEMECGGV